MYDGMVELKERIDFVTSYSAFSMNVMEKRSEVSKIILEFSLRKEAALRAQDSDFSTLLTEALQPLRDKFYIAEQNCWDVT